MNSTVIIFVLISVLIVWGISIYNSIVKNYNAVKRAWSNVLAEETNKRKTIPKLEGMLKNYGVFESDLLVKITELRSSIASLDAKKVNPHQLKNVELATNEVLSGINITMEAYPDLKMDKIVQNVMKELVEQQENITASIRILNQNIEVFNNNIEVFPNSFINANINKKTKIDTFTDEESSKVYAYNPF